MQLEIRGHRLPGRSWPGQGGTDNLQIGIQLKAEPAELVPADAPEAIWRTEIEVIERDGEADFRGPAIHGKRGERFVYLVWVGVDSDGSPTRLGRAKLMLADVVAAGAGADDVVVARVDLTDSAGRPRCARLREPAVSVQAG
jgi:hypothetical protein